MGSNSIQSEMLANYLQKENERARFNIPPIIIDSKKFEYNVFVPISDKTLESNTPHLIMEMRTPKSARIRTPKTPQAIRLTEQRTRSPTDFSMNTTPRQAMIHRLKSNGALVKHDEI